MQDTPKAPPRKAPPPLLPVKVSGLEAVNPRTMRVQFAGDSLRDMEVPQPAASVRLLIPSEPDGELVVPEWTGNEFLLPDGERPVIRTFTPLRFDRDAGSVDLEIVRHDGGAVSAWVERCVADDPAAISGPGAGWEPVPATTELLVFGDETAIPAIGQLLDAATGLDAPPACTVHIEVSTPDSQRDVGPVPATEIDWHTADPALAPMSGLVAAAKAIESVSEQTHIWAAGEAAAVQAMRKHFLRVLGVPRERASIRGYWKSR